MAVPFLAVACCPEVTLSTAIEGRYTIERDGEPIAYLELKDGIYSVTPSDDSMPLAELEIHFFGANPSGTYSITYRDPSSADTLRSELDEGSSIWLCTIDFDSSRSHSGQMTDWRLLLYDGQSEKLYFMIIYGYLDRNPVFISKPWE
jgi:hypothetical protein